MFDVLVFVWKNVVWWRLFVIKEDTYYITMSEVNDKENVELAWAFDYESVVERWLWWINVNMDFK